MIMLNSIFPNYFEGLIVIDPVGTPIEQSESVLPLGREHNDSQDNSTTVKDYPVPSDVPLTRGAIARKDVFPSR